MSFTSNILMVMTKGENPSRPRVIAFGMLVLCLVDVAASVGYVHNECGRAHWAPFPPPASIAELEYNAGYPNVSGAVSGSPVFCFLRPRPDELLRSVKLASFYLVTEHCKLPNSPGDIKTLVSAALQAVGNATLLFVGDSFTGEMYTSLHLLLHEYVIGEYYEEIKYRDMVFNAERRFTPGFSTSTGLNVISIRHDHLVHSKTGLLQSIRDDRTMADAGDYFFDKNKTATKWNFPYWDVLVNKATYVVLNTAGHWGGTGYTEMVDNVVSSLKLQFRGRRVYYRSSTPGHDNCTGVTEPLAEYDIDQVQASYNWNMMPKWDKLWRDAMAGDSLFKFLDVSFSSLRPDSHRIRDEITPSGLRRNVDCGHHCLPGVPDVWNFLLLHELVRNPGT